MIVYCNMDELHSYPSLEQTLKEFSCTLDGFTSTAAGVSSTVTQVASNVISVSRTRDRTKVSNSLEINSTIETLPLTLSGWTKRDFYTSCLQ